jgi:hypothetical protein
MYVLVYLAAAITLIRCAHPGYRKKTVARWKRSPTYQIVLEIGGGLIGLLILLGVLLMVLMEI